MAKKTTTVAPRQMSFDEILSERVGELINLPISPDDIGGALLSILTKGLYTNPLDCIREYVQNAVDAKATDVKIQITGNSVTIHDNGSGMTHQELIQARQFAMSEKTLADFVGFRGIGIYSGFDLCRRMRITSKKEGSPLLHTVVFEFAAMKGVLEADKARKPDEGKTSLIKLLSEYTFIKREASEFPLEHHFTTVVLQDISDTHIKQISDRAELQRYLLDNLPIDFDDKFEYKKLINDQLFNHVSGYNPIKITLQSDELDDQIVSKPAIPGLQTPTYGYVTTSSGHEVGYYWACLNATRGKISSNKNPQTGSIIEGLQNYEGFVYKVKGFTIGDRLKLRPLFTTRQQLYVWYTGEIFVTDPNVIPNAERNDFETNQAKRALELAVQENLFKGLIKDAETFRDKTIAKERIESYSTEIASIENQVANNVLGSEIKTISRLEEVISDLKEQKSKATPSERQTSEDLINRAKRLQKQMHKDVDNPVPEATRKKRVAKNKPIQQESLPFVVPVISPPPEKPKTLLDILKELDLEYDNSTLNLVGLIQESIEETLRLNSTTYNSLINLIKAKLTSLNPND